MTTEMIFLQFLRLISIFTLILHTKIVSTVPPDYCLYQLNKTDCGAKPSLVYSYYKPGSRCELETWRGCPTYNKFPNQYLCSNTCIYRFYDSGENKIFKDERPKKKRPVGDVPSWEEEVRNLSYKENQVMSFILDKVAKNFITTSPTITNRAHKSTEPNQSLTSYKKSTTVTNTAREVSTKLPQEAFVTSTKETTSQGTTTQQITDESTHKASVVTTTSELPTTIQQVTTESKIEPSTVTTTSEMSTTLDEATTEPPIQSTVVTTTSELPTSITTTSTSTSTTTTSTTERITEATTSKPSTTTTKHTIAPATVSTTTTRATTTISMDTMDIGYPEEVIIARVSNFTL